MRRLDFSQVCHADGPKLFISATNVRTGKIRVFSGDEISPEALMASACLPTAFQAVELTDPQTGQVEAFWDGGYAGNPALFPVGVTAPPGVEGQMNAFSFVLVAGALAGLAQLKLKL